jgi:hypothetical protein
MGVYYIENLLILENPVEMNELKERYGFTAPQSFFAMSQQGSEFLRKEIIK